MCLIRWEERKINDGKVFSLWFHQKALSPKLEKTKLISKKWCFSHAFTLMPPLLNSNQLRHSAPFFPPFPLLSSIPQLSRLSNLLILFFVFFSLYYVFNLFFFFLFLLIHTHTYIYIYIYIYIIRSKNNIICMMCKFFKILF